MENKVKMCRFEDCNKEATTFACERNYLGKIGHEVAAWYCEKHAYVVTGEGHPEYVVDCPACGCQFGVN